MTAVPLLGLAFGTGTLAGLSPCGIGMLPSYVGMVLGTSPGQRPGWKGLGVGLRITGAFVLLFALSAMLIGLVATAFIDLIPWAAVGVGALVAGWGALGLLGRRFKSIDLRAFTGMGARTDGRQVGVYTYGILYGIACLSCSLPLFLSLVLQTLQAHSPAGTVLILVAYGLGLGVVVTTVSVLTATARDLLARRLRRILPYVDRAGSAFVLASGLYVMWYWLSGPGGLLAVRT